ncbi:hypothetical protein J3458_002115 [Metarhizium acridum]|uniref:uncharacterized protein n=1 Tax=Metarhizium acridum TaxID=92637 RepID=UPI001C6D23E4|nr:hypothetical protein J3458_002115 [Metarhizium acridum]
MDFVLQLQLWRKFLQVVELVISRSLTDVRLHMTKVLVVTDNNWSNKLFIINTITQTLLYINAQCCAASFCFGRLPPNHQMTTHTLHQGPTFKHASPQLLRSTTFP